MQAELQDKVVLVTGAGRGIGKAIAQVCAREGAKVIVSSNEEGPTEAVATALPGEEGRHSALFLDVTQDSNRRRAFDFIMEKYGRLDGLVNNAGIDFSEPFLETTPAEWQRVMEVDFNAVLELCQQAIALYKELGGGKIVNISSVHTHATYIGAGPYAAAKGAVRMLTKSLTCEFAKDNIQVNCVAPGITRTDIWQAHVERHGSEAAALAYWSKNIPAGKIVEPEQVGEVVSFLLSDRANSINGTTIYIDDGLTSQLIASD